MHVLHHSFAGEIDIGITNDIHVVSKTDTLKGEG